MTSEKEDNHLEESVRIEPIVAIYCGVCKLPVEYCEYKDSLPECQKWLKANNSECFALVYPDINLVEGVSDMNTADTDEQEDTPRKGKSGKVAKKKAISIRVVDRTKRKRVTEVSGLDGFDLDLKKVSKQFSSKFACGSAVTKLATGLEEIHIAGDFALEVQALLQDVYKINPKDITIAEPKKK